MPSAPNTPFKDLSPAMKAGIPLSVALGSLLMYGRLRDSTEANLAEAEDYAEAARQSEVLRNAGDMANLRGAALDKSASVVAYSAGRQLAKVALSPLGALAGAGKGLVKRLPAIGRKSGWKGQAALGVGAAGLGYLGLKGGQKAYEFGMQAPAAKVQGAPGPLLPRYVNEWGQPTM